MAEAQQSQGDDEASDEQSGFEYHAQVKQHPTTIVDGAKKDVVTGADIDGDKESTGTSFGVVIDDPSVEAGTLWKNSNIPEGFVSTSEYNDLLRVAINGDDLNYVRGQEVTDELISEARDRIADTIDINDDEWGDVAYDANKISGTDYKIADPDDQDARIGYNSDGDQTGIDVGGGEFESVEVDDFDTDTIMVWYGGMAGQFVGRGLDFNGMPFARHTEGDEDNAPYLVKGLFQVPKGWRGEADVQQYDDVPTTDRSELARAESNGGLGRAPRVARPPILRGDLDGRTFVALGRYGGGNMFEVHIGRAMDDYSDVLDALDSNDDPEEYFDPIEMRYDDDADEIITSEFDSTDVMELYHGEGWANEPETTADSGGDNSGGDSGGSFDLDVETDDSVDHPTDREVEFAENIAEKIAGTGVSPDDEIFPTDNGNVDLEGIVEARADVFDHDPDTDAIRRVVYETTDHLSADDI